MKIYLTRDEVYHDDEGAPCVAWSRSLQLEMLEDVRELKQIKSCVDSKATLISERKKLVAKVEDLTRYNKALKEQRKVDKQQIAELRKLLTPKQIDLDFAIRQRNGAVRDKLAMRAELNTMKDKMRSIIK